MQYDAVMRELKLNQFKHLLLLPFSLFHSFLLYPHSLNTHRCRQFHVCTRNYGAKLVSILYYSQYNVIIKMLNAFLRFILHTHMGKYVHATAAYDDSNFFKWLII